MHSRALQPAELVQIFFVSYSKRKQTPTSSPPPRFAYIAERASPWSENGYKVHD